MSKYIQACQRDNPELDIPDDIDPMNIKVLGVDKGILRLVITDIKDRINR